VLLSKASLEPDPLLRLAYVTAFQISRYCTAVDRLQKPFNPLLGETYELVTNHYRLIAEQVSHHPPITAYHVEAQGYELFSQQVTTMRFNGRHMITEVKDRVYVKLKL
jgi:hypothetical protein